MLIVVVQDRTLMRKSPVEVNSMSLFSRSERHRTLSATAVRPAADVTIRRACPDDSAALLRLAALDSSPRIAGDALLAEVAGELWAAVSLADGRMIADPFRRTAGVVGLLEYRARQISNGAQAQPRPLDRLVPLLDGH
jgi:hypothetical protein